MPKYLGAGLYRKNNFGTGFSVTGKPILYGNITAGSNLSINSIPFQTSITTDKQGKVILGNNVFVNGAFIHARNRIEIGDWTKIGFRAMILDSDLHGIDGQPERIVPVKIGNYVWIAAGAMVLKGVTIGAHAIVAAGAVITKDVEDHTLVAGNPAKRIRSTSGYTPQNQNKP